MYTITVVHVDGRRTVLRNYNRECIFRDAEKLENILYYKLHYRPIGQI